MQKQSKYGIRSFLLSCLLFFFASNACFATPDDDGGRLNAYLTQEKINLTLANHDEELLLKPSASIGEVALIRRKKQNATMQSLMQAKIAGLTDFLADQRKQQQRLQPQQEAA